MILDLKGREGLVKSLLPTVCGCKKPLRFGTGFRLYPPEVKPGPALSSLISRKTPSDVIRREGARFTFICPQCAKVATRLGSKPAGERTLVASSPFGNVPSPFVLLLQGTVEQPAEGVDLKGLHSMLRPRQRTVTTSSVPAAQGKQVAERLALTGGEPEVNALASALEAVFALRLSKAQRRRIEDEHLSGAVGVRSFRRAALAMLEAATPKRR